MSTTARPLTDTAVGVPDLDVHRRWLPRLSYELPLSLAGQAAGEALGNAPVPPSAPDIIFVAAAWFRETGVCERDQAAFVLHAAGLGEGLVAAEVRVCRRSVANMLRRARRALVRRARDLCAPSRERAALTLWLAEEPLPLIAAVLGVRPERATLALGRIVRGAFADRGDADDLARACWAEMAARPSARRRAIVIG